METPTSVDCILLLMDAEGRGFKDESGRVMLSEEWTDATVEGVGGLLDFMLVNPELTCEKVERPALDPAPI